MSETFRIHGDNIVECERIAKIILNEVHPTSISTSLLSPSTIVLEFQFVYQQIEKEWQLILLPGFNKSGRHRWEENIFQALRDSGSFLEETPDAIITKVENGQETILYAIEFCSALQAGNQAWQRSGRAYSTGRTGCPYLYIVDFVKYELDSETRERKALRFPNPAVPFSYTSFSRNTGNFVAQVYVQSEEFDKSRDDALTTFNEENFASVELATYMVKKMCGLSTEQEEAEILRKNMNVVSFLAENSITMKSFSPDQWEAINDNWNGDIIGYSLQESPFVFHKTITAKGHHGKSPQMLNIIDKYSVGIASRDLPFGLIPADKRPFFARELGNLYPNFNHLILSKIARTDKGLILCLIKGFKPRGDDARPDRGILPFAVMLVGNTTEIMTYIYGPVLEDNYQKLINHPRQLANSNGLWKSVLALSDYLVLDVPIIGGRRNRDEELLLDTSPHKAYYTTIDAERCGMTRPAFSSVPGEYHEDDVDTGIHFLFTHILGSSCFEGMCNPPGGDWSGMSIIDDNKEKRWLSLPRVSEDVNSKRPDHVLEIFGVYDKPIFLAIESKERAGDLEPNVGNSLKNFIKYLLDYVPSVERIIHPQVGQWLQSRQAVDIGQYILISAAAYLKSASLQSDIVFRNSNCDMLFIMDPVRNGWEIEIICATEQAEVLKQFIKDELNRLGALSLIRIL